MRRLKPTPALLLPLLLLVAVPARAQGSRSATIDGAVTDARGAPIAATVTLSAEEGGFSRTVATPRDGRFGFTMLPPGVYTLRAEQFGYRPKVTTGIRLRRGQELGVPVSIEATAGPATSADTVAYAGSSLAGLGPALTVPIPAWLLREYPDEQRGATGLGRYAALADGDLATQGLPAAFSGVRVDGVTALAPGSPALVPGSLRAAAYPVGMFESAALVATDPDVEWSGLSGGSLDGIAHHGGRGTDVEAFGAWSGSALRSGYDGPDVGSYQAAQGGVRVSGALLPDTASYVVGVEAWRLAAPLPLPLGVDAARALAVARQTYGADGTPSAGAANVVSAYGGFSWQLSDATHLDVRVSGAALPSSDGGGYGVPTATVVPSYSGHDLDAAAMLTGRVGSSGFQELDFSWRTSGRDYDAVDPLGIGGSTTIAATGVTLGAEPGFPRSYGQSDFRLAETVHLRRGAHRLKLGALVGRSGFSTDPSTTASFAFADTAAFAAGTGAYVFSRPSAGTVEFATPRGALYAQDTWRGSPGLELLAGVRLDAGRLPHGEASPSAAWRQASGLDVTDLHSSWLRLSPRAGFSWDLQGRHAWVVSGSAGLYSGQVDPLLLGGWIEGSRGDAVRRGFGSVAGWPGAPAASEGDAAPRLTLIDPRYAPPRTVRGSLGLTGAAGAGTVVRLAGLFRYTDLLPRYTDLNLAPSPAGTDQFGRPLLGTLEQHGALLTAVAGSNRRFADFDRVTAIDLDGWSRYAGLLIGFEHHAPGGLDVFGNYTFSRTTDDWTPSSGADFTLPIPAPAPDGGDWLEGRSAYDVPQRLALGAELPVPSVRALRVGLLYRYRSGDPFTPGFAPGVDANADGVAGNDPAYLDPSIPGLSDLVSRWSCLGSSSGGFAVRNSCRTDGVHTLDARLSLGVLSLGRATARLVVDGLNLLASGEDVPDRALLAIDPSGSLSTDPVTGVTTVPLVANPHFGEPLGSLGSGRVLRVGFQLGY